MNAISAPDQPISTLSCSRCGREGSQAIFTCPDRVTGGCLFVEESRKRSFNWANLLILIMLAVMLIILTLPDPSPLSRLGLGLAGKLLSVAAWALFLLFSVLMLFPIEVVLHDPASGLRLRRKTLGKIELSRASIAPPEPVAINLELPAEVVHPPSVVILPGGSASASMNLAVNVVSAALVGLLLRRQVQMCRSLITESKLGRQPTIHYEYLLSRVGGLELPDKGVGCLERGVLIVTLTTPVSRPSGMGLPHSAGIPLRHILDSVYSGSTSNPAGWLVMQVANDAVSLGLGHFDRGLPGKHYDWDETVKAQVEQERAALLALINRLGEVQPDLLTALNGEIRTGIKAHQATSRTYW